MEAELRLNGRKRERTKNVIHRIRKAISQILQTDYWAMSDAELEKVAMSRKIPPISRTGDHLQYWYVDRDRVINALLVRDHALRNNKLALIALTVSLGSFLISIIALIRK